MQDARAATAAARGCDAAWRGEVNITLSSPLPTPPTGIFLFKIQAPWPCHLQKPTDLLSSHGFEQQISQEHEHEK